MYCAVFEKWEYLWCRNGKNVKLLKRKWVILSISFCVLVMFICNGLSYNILKGGISMYGYGYPYGGYGYGAGSGFWIIIVVLIIFFVLFWGTGNNNGGCCPHNSCNGCCPK